MKLGYAQLHMLSNEMLSAVRKGPPERLAHLFNTDKVEGIQQGVLLALLPLLILVGDEADITIDDAFAALGASDEEIAAVKPSLTMLIKRLRELLPEDNEVDDALAKRATFRLLDTIKLAVNAICESLNDLDTVPEGAARAGVITGSISSVAGILFALSEEYHAPLPALLDSMNIPSHYRAMILDNAEHLATEPSE